MMPPSDSTIRLPPSGRVLSILHEDPRVPLHWLACARHAHELRVVVHSRMAPQRLGQHLPLDRIEFKWLSETMDPHAMSPTLERIQHAISTRVASDGGIIWLDAVEYLIHRQGFDAFLAFTRSLADELVNTGWTVLLPFTPLSLEGTEVAHLRREAMPFDVEMAAPIREMEAEPAAELLAEPVEEGGADEEVIDASDDAPTPPPASPLVLLSTIAGAALTPAVLRRRQAQWVEMGFEVSALDHAVTLEPAARHAAYLEVEERVRHAVELDRRIAMAEVRGHRVEAVKMRFRIMQLTGLDAVEGRLDELLGGEI